MCCEAPVCVMGARRCHRFLSSSAVTSGHQAVTGPSDVTFAKMTRMRKEHRQRFLLHDVPSLQKHVFK